MIPKKYLLVPGNVSSPTGQTKWVGILDLIARHKLDARECVGIHGGVYREMSDHELLKLIVITPDTPSGFIKWREGRLLPVRWGFGIAGLIEFGDRG